MEDDALEALELIVPNLNWRYSGVTAVNRTMAPLLARRCRAAWSARTGRGRSAAAAARSLALALRRPGGTGAHLARPAQCGNDHRRRASGARFSLRPRLHVGGAASSHLDHACFDRPDGRGDRDHRGRRLLSEAQRDRHLPWDRYHDLSSACRPRGCIRRNRASRPLRDRRVRARSAAKGHRRVRRRHVPAVAAIPGLHRGRDRARDGGASAVLRAPARHGRRGGTLRAHAFLGEVPIEEVPRWYQRISIYAFTSRKKGSG